MRVKEVILRNRKFFNRSLAFVLPALMFVAAFAAVIIVAKIIGVVGFDVFGLSTQRTVSVIVPLAVCGVLLQIMIEKGGHYTWTVFSLLVVSAAAILATWSMPIPDSASATFGQLLGMIAYFMIGTLLGFGLMNVRKVYEVMRR
ncbi:MAG: hypothetical protein Q8P99_00365 [bacterium]|nr:hypothetical protein [bacterium]